MYTLYILLTLYSKRSSRICAHGDHRNAIASFVFARRRGYCGFLFETAFVLSRADLTRPKPSHTLRRQHTTSTRQHILCISQSTARRFPIAIRTGLFRNDVLPLLGIRPRKNALKRNTLYTHLRAVFYGPSVLCAPKVFMCCCASCVYVNEMTNIY